MFVEDKPGSLEEMIKTFHPFANTEGISNVVDGVLTTGKWLNGINVRDNGGSFV
jgi:hypothetical protein